MKIILQKVQDPLKQDYEREGFHLQRLYGRRKINEKGQVRSTFGDIMSSSAMEV